jgi:tetratricopeptide (TPR) repeat protein
MKNILLDPNEEAWCQIEYEISILENDEEFIQSLQISKSNLGLLSATKLLRGIVLHDLKHYAKAIRSYDDTFAYNPGIHDAIYNKACCYALMNDIDNALDCLRQAIALDPKYREMAKTDSDFDAIRADERFRGAVEGES